MTSFKSVIACSFALLGVIASSSMAEPGPGSLPVMKHVGPIPVQWEGTAQDLFGLENPHEYINQAFSKAVRDAKRFQILNDEIVAELWGHAEGRQELQTQYELDAYASLTATPNGDVVTLLARLLSPGLENYLVESETLSRSWLANASEIEVHDSIQTLVFRLFNRIPVDVSVTSVQGRYITVSGGSEQNVHNGDELVFYRTAITSRHPANGAWLSFENKKLGVARIVETKVHSSVAELLKLSYEGAIKVGDGAKITGISARNKFQRLLQEPEFIDSKDGTPIVIPPIYSSKKKRSDIPGPNTKTAELVPAEKPATPPPAPVAVPETPKEDLPEFLAETAPEQVSPAAPSGTPTQEGDPLAPSAAGDAAPNTDADLQVQDSVSTSPPPEFVSFLADQFGLNYLYFSAGPKLWSTSGAAGASSKLPLWLFNSARVTGGTSINELVKLEGTGEVGFGPTDKGSFSGFGVEGRAYVTQNIKGMFESADTVRLGGFARFDSLGVGGEKFGGGDVVKLGAFLGVRGMTSMAEIKRSIEWFGDLDFIPEAFGTIGVNGQKRDITRSTAFKISTGAYLVGPKKSLEWGAMVSYGADYYDLSPKSLSVVELYMGGLARYRF